MVKRKHPEGCTEELPATVIEDSEAATTIGTSVCDNGKSPEGTIRETLSPPTIVDTTEPVEMTVAELGPFWSLLMEASYTVW